jgi:hypothetical protein
MGGKYLPPGNLLPMASWQSFSRHWFPGKCLYGLWMAALISKKTNKYLFLIV